MALQEDYLLRIYLGETDTHGGQPLYEWIVRRAREQGLAGVTVLCGVKGFGAHSCSQRGKILRLSGDQPLVIEIVDTRPKLEAFLALINPAIKVGLATLEKVEICFYRSGVDAERPG